MAHDGMIAFDAAGKRYSAVFGFKAMKTVEAHYDLPFFRALQDAMPQLSPEDAGDPAKVAAAGASIRMAAVSKLFEAALMKHHPELTEDAIDDLIDEIGIARAGEILGQAVSAAIAKQEGDDGSPAGPRKAKRGPPNAKHD